MIKILKASRKDLKILREIFYKERVSNFFWMTIDEIKVTDFDEATKDEEIYIAKIGNITVGFISIYVIDKFIHNLFVDSTYKGYGIGRALIAFASDKLGYPMRLKCVIKNEKALGFYEHLGWKKEQEIHENEPHYLMKLEKMEAKN